MKKLLARPPTMALCFASLFGCGARGGAKTGQFGQEANYPLYYVASGSAAGGAALYRVEAVPAAGIGQGTLVVDGLSKPGGIAEDPKGAVYITETLAAPNGKVIKVKGGTASDFMTGLDYPTGIAVDTFGQVYVAASGTQQILKVNAAGQVTVLTGAGLGSLEAATIDGTDSLYLVESSPEVVSKIHASGQREVLAATGSGISSIARSPDGHLYLLSVDAVKGTGSLGKLTGGHLSEVLGGLTSPSAIAFDNSGAICITEGAPANRISRYSPETGSLRVLVNTSADPSALSFTPF